MTFLYKICLVSVVFPLALVIGVPPLNAAGKGTVCFNTIEPTTNLNWPITNPRDPGQLIGHGPHSLFKLEEYRNIPPNNSVDYLHQRHSVHNLFQVADFLEKNPSFEVPDLICQALKQLDFSGENVWLNYQYNYFENGDTEEQIFEALKTRAADQSDLFGLVNGENLGKLMMKEWKGKESLTVEEVEYLHQWHSPASVTLGAMGLYCNRGSWIKKGLRGYVEKLDSETTGIKEGDCCTEGCCSRWCSWNCPPKHEQHDVKQEVGAPLDVWRGMFCVAPPCNCHDRFSSSTWIPFDSCDQKSGAFMGQPFQSAKGFYHERGTGSVAFYSDSNCGNEINRIRIPDNTCTSAHVSVGSYAYNIFSYTQGGKRPCSNC